MHKIIPKPRKIRIEGGFYTIDTTTVIHVGPGDNRVKAVGEYLAGLLAPATGLKRPVEAAASAGGRGINLVIDMAKSDLGDEGYNLTCAGTGVTIIAAAPAGLFYGVQTLRQLLPAELESGQKVDGVAWQVPCVSIEDCPKFRWRGYLIDPARHFRTKKELKRYIDLLSLLKMNIIMSQNPPRIKTEQL